MAELDETTAGSDPITFFTRWFSEAQKAEVSEVNAMTLATVDAQNIPDARIVLLKGLENEEFVFYTNYMSTKGKDMQENPHACLVFFWKELERQVRVRGTVSKVAPEVSDEYFNIRPVGSQLGAWASPQSDIIPDRSILSDNYESLEKKYQSVKVPRPEHWGGYTVKPFSIEFWQGRSNRMHDRILFSRSENSTWSKSRLAP